MPAWSAISKPPATMENALSQKLKRNTNLAKEVSPGHFQAGSCRVNLQGQPQKQAELKAFMFLNRPGTATSHWFEEVGEVHLLKALRLQP